MRVIFLAWIFCYVSAVSARCCLFWSYPKPSCPDQRCSTRCRPTCANPRPPPDCPETNYDPNDPCQCPSGYILCQRRGKCVLIEDCPKNLGCNGDPNAVIRACPSMCPATCDSPEDMNCCDQCEVGCACKDGFILEQSGGRCIRPDKCPC